MVSLPSPEPVSDEEASAAVFCASAPASSAFASEEPAAPWASSSAADSASTGAGVSGSSWPSCGTSIQRTTSLLEYVWIALNTNWSASSGSAPMETGNFWK
ncbi:hypothetical protein SVIOM342S_06928 [Streptomyces violaceorubidus]